MVRALWVLAMGVASVLFAPASANAALVSQDSPVSANRAVPANDVLEARQYRLPDSRVAGQESVRQSVTAWEVTGGTWNGELLQGLSLVLVCSTPDNGQSHPTISCYISHLATTAQRNALLSAFVAAQSLAPSEVTNWRVEPAVIKFDLAGQTIIIHLCLVA